jgi:hypothetical protein
MRGRILGGLAAILVSVAAQSALAEAPTAPASPRPAPAVRKAEPVQTRALPTKAEKREHRLVWKYPKFRLWQYAAAGITSGVNLYIEFGGPEYPDSRYRGPVLFDGAARSLFRVEDPETANRIASSSDYLWYGTQYFSFFDGIVTPLLFDDGNFEVAWQLSMINWQGIGLSFFMTRLMHLAVGRARPSQYGCSDAPDAEFKCSSAGPSFISGHTSMSAVGAGMACMHHQYLPLYGGGAPDIAICAVMGASVLAVGSMRLMSDRHWASDVIAGLVVGGGIGVGLPWLLHYSKTGPEPLGAGFLPPTMAIVPTLNDGQPGLAAIGLF